MRPLATVVLLAWACSGPAGTFAGTLYAFPECGAGFPLAKDAADETGGTPHAATVRADYSDSGAAHDLVLKVPDLSLDCAVRVTSLGDGPPGDGGACGADRIVWIHADAAGGGPFEAERLALDAVLENPPPASSCVRLHSRAGEHLVLQE